MTTMMMMTVTRMRSERAARDAAPLVTLPVSETLSSKGRQVTSVEDKKSMGRPAMLKEVAARATVNHNVCGSDRGMSLATKASFGFMA